MKGDKETFLNDKYVHYLDCNMISKVHKCAYIAYQLLIIPQEKKRMAGEMPYKTSLALH